MGVITRKFMLNLKKYLNVSHLKEFFVISEEQLRHNIFENDALALLLFCL